MDKTQETTGQLSECLGSAFKPMRRKFAGRRRRRAERNHYRNCARSLCFLSRTFFHHVAKQIEHNLKIVRYKDQREKNKTKEAQQRGSETHGRRRGGSLIPSSCSVAAKQMHVDLPDGRGGGYAKTCFRHTSAAVSVSGSEPLGDSGALKRRFPPVGSLLFTGEQLEGVHAQCTCDYSSVIKRNPYQ